MIKSGEEIGMCPSCSLTIRIIYDTVNQTQMIF